MNAALTLRALPERIENALRSLSDPPCAPGWNHAELADLLDAPTRTPAAVLVPLIRRDTAVHLLLTRRTEALSQHAGQVSFPGGRIEANDVDAVAAALRETQEETGIDPALIQPLGFLDSYETISGFCVVPVVAWLDPEYHAQPDAREVAEIFEVPFEFFLDPANLRRLRIDYRGQSREIYEFSHANQRIWGATAAMLINFVHRIGTLP